MIARLRRVHHAIHRLLWLPVVLLFLAALMSRRPIEVRDDGPLALFGSELAAGARDDATPGRHELVGSSFDAFGPWPARIALHRDGTFELAPLRPLDRPELLLYWVPDERVDQALPGSAQLLGRLTGTRVRRFRLPQGAMASTAVLGCLVVYSLGHQEIVAVAPLSSIGASRNPVAEGKDGA